ncbi:hypothetical protein THIOSC15_2720005 [uncultured Thiomicrorhabdus sp.]
MTTSQTDHKLYEIQIIGAISSIAAMSYLKNIEQKAEITFDYSPTSNAIVTKVIEAENASPELITACSTLIFLSPTVNDTSDSNKWVAILENLKTLQNNISQL